MARPTGNCFKMMKRLLHFSVFKIMYQVVVLIFGTAILMVVHILRPVVFIRIGQLVYSRIGHLASNTEYWLRKVYSVRKQGEFYVLLSSPHPANRQLVEMIKRKVPVKESDLLLSIYSHVRNKWPNSSVWVNLDTSGTHDYALWSKSNPQLSFTQAEETKGKELLQSMGVPPDEPFVCFAIRDKSYLEKTQPHDTGYWRYHDYRDADIDNCRLMAEWLASQGIWVLRMGAVVEKPFIASHPRIIDYATKYRSDFTDVYLLGHCKFFVGDTAGIFWVPEIMGVPTALTNDIPITHLHVSSKGMFIPKKYKRIDCGQFMSYREVVEKGYDGFLASRQYEEAGIDLVENTPEEILDLVQEMNARIEGTWVSTNEDEELHERFWSIFPPGHPSYGCPARVPINFLKRNKELIV